MQDFTTQFFKINIRSFWKILKTYLLSVLIANMGFIFCFNLFERSIFLELSLYKFLCYITSTFILSHLKIFLALLVFYKYILRYYVTSDRVTLYSSQCESRYLVTIIRLHNYSTFYIFSVIYPEHGKEDL